MLEAEAAVAVGHYIPTTKAVVVRTLPTQLYRSAVDRFALRALDRHVHRNAFDESQISLLDRPVGAQGEHLAKGLRRAGAGADAVLGPKLEWRQKEPARPWVRIH